MNVAGFTRLFCKSCVNGRLNSGLVQSRKFKDTFVHTRGLRNSRNLKPDEIPFSQRLQILFRPAVFALTVSGGTYLISKVYPPNSMSFLESLRYRIQYENSEKFDPVAKWKSLSPSGKLVYSIIACNIAVFIAWRLNPNAAWMHRYMVAEITGGAPCVSMLGSIFSHIEPLHIFFNMYVLSSLTDIIPNPAHLLHIYISGGLVAALGSYARTLSTTPLRVSRSLGASGAILALIGYTVTKFPEARFSIALLDQIYPHSFTAQTAFMAIVTFDSCGLLFGWKLFDHAAHLAGILYGALARKIEAAGSTKR